MPSIWKLFPRLFIKQKKYFGGCFEAVWGCRGCLGIKHSLDVGITSKMEESHILHGKNDTTSDFFFLLRQKCILGRLYPPWVSITALASLVRKDDPRGGKDALGNTSAWGEKKILGGILFPWRKETFFHFSGNSERRVHVFLRHLEKMSHPFF